MSGKLIASTMTHRVYPLDQALEHLVAAGFDTVELCAVGSWVPHFDAENATDKTVFETARMIASKGAKVHCLNVGGYTLAQMQYVYALAHETGAAVVTYPCGSLPEGADSAEFIRERAELNAKLADLGDQYGIVCAVEAPHKRTVAENSAQIDAYWEAQDPRVKCTFDTAHLTYAGEDMIAVAKKYASRMAHSHLRDAVKGNSLLRYGEGVVDFARYLKTVKDGGYTGFFSMEYPADSEEEAAERLRASAGYLARFDI